MAGRSPEEVTIVAATKTVTPDRLEEAYALGLRHFGENRFQEALTKMEALPGDIVWHFIGTLQSNKAKRAAELFDAIHTLERESQLKEIAKSSRAVDGLIEINIADEPQKSGILSTELDGFRKSVLYCSQVRLRGLMTVGPALDDPEAMRPWFRRLRELGETVGAEWLSMGMSHDFDVAIQEGATHVRIGSALFGRRT